jgi:hypothetical protein
MPFSFGRPPELPKQGQDSWPFMRWLGALADRITNHAKTEFRLDDYKRADEADYSAAFLRAANENPLATTHYGIPLQVPAAKHDFLTKVVVPAGTFQNKLHCIEGIGGGGGDIKPTIVFHETGSGIVQLDFTADDAYPAIKDVQFYHNSGIPTTSSHGTLIKFNNASHARIRDIWLAYGDVGIEWAGQAFYGYSLGLNSFYQYSAGVKYSGNLMNGHVVIAGSASQTQNGPGDYATNIGSHMGFIGRYREGNVGNGKSAMNFHIIYDIGLYTENNTLEDATYPNIYAYQTANVFRAACYHDILQGSGKARVRAVKTRFVDIQSKFYNEEGVPPYSFDESNQYLCRPSIFANCEYRTADIVSNESGHVIIDQKHPFVFWDTASPTFPSQVGTYVHNKNTTTVGRIRGYVYTAAGWPSPPALTPTATTTLGSNEIALNNSLTNIGPGDHISVTGETFGGSATAMVLYVEPGISLFVDADADTGVSGAAMAFKTATIKTDYFPVRGTFTCTNAATTTVSDQAAAVLATSVITLMPTNAAAATLMSGAKSLYVSTRTAATSFVVSTADGNAAAGTETFEYIIHNT